MAIHYMSNCYLVLFSAFNADYVYHDFLESSYTSLFTNFKNEFDNIESNVSSNSVFDTAS
ncbi:hypothetical protein BOFE_09450 (plasmid) [Candidatus Borrelia fainii]|uniref:Uncharacterized protein n=2 Tax=Candidatus Borrelia fainii TaxID=2518322 RepID=A0ABM8DLW6_9SPIR|nr:hypothetical protein BOFE_09450 [Candidatus Borrelia fainii]